MPVQPLITVEEFRGIFAIPKGINDGQLTGPLASASRELQTWVKADVYQDSAANDAATDQDRRTQLDYAEALIAMSYAVVDLNLRVSPDGILKSDKEEGNVVVQNLTPKEALELQEQFLTKASKVAGPYLVQKEPSENSLSTRMPPMFTLGRARRIC